VKEKSGAKLSPVLLSQSRVLELLTSLLLDMRVRGRLPHDLRSQHLRPPLLLPKVLSAPIQLRRVHLLVEIAPGPEPLFILRKLIPSLAITRSAGRERGIAECVGVGDETGGGRVGRGGLPGLEDAFSARKES
jgi:hypothetical protein